MPSVEIVSEAPRIGRVGMQILCSNPACLSRIGRLVKEVRDFRAVAGDDFQSDVGTDAIRFEPSQTHAPGEPAVCCRCSSPYLVRENRPLAGITELFLHTDIGWIPRLPISCGGPAPPEWGSIEYPR